MTLIVAAFAAWLLVACALAAPVGLWLRHTSRRYPTPQGKAGNARIGRLP